MPPYAKIFAPHVHAVLFMPEDERRARKGIDLLVEAGVDDIWIIVSDIVTTLMALQHARMTLHPGAGVVGFPMKVDTKTCFNIAERCNSWSLWTHGADGPKPYRSGIKWFASVSGGMANPDVDVDCLGDPLAMKPEEQDVFFSQTHSPQSALCGCITPGMISRHFNHFGLYVVSPFCGMDSNKWPLHADVCLVKELCQEAMVFKKELAETSAC